MPTSSSPPTGPLVSSKVFVVTYSANKLGPGWRQLSTSHLCFIDGATHCFSWGWVGYREPASFAKSIQIWKLNLLSVSSSLIAIGYWKTTSLSEGSKWPLRCFIYFHDYWRPSCYPHVILLPHYNSMTELNVTSDHSDECQSSPRHERGKINIETYYWIDLFLSLFISDCNILYMTLRI